MEIHEVIMMYLWSKVVEISNINGLGDGCVDISL